MLGSATDAEDAVQETLVRAWRAAEQFAERASVRTWLYSIATNVCLDALADRKRRARPILEGPHGSVSDELVSEPRSHWLEPIADTRALPEEASPAELAILRQSVRLAFVAALQKLPAKQRAVLLLADVLGWSAAEVGQTLQLSVPAVNSALQRARATLATDTLPPAEPLSATQRALLDRYVDAFQRYDVPELTRLMREDTTFSMPPFALWLRGSQQVEQWLLGRGSGCRGSRLLPTAACGSPAFAQYRPAPQGGHRAFALIVLELSEDHITGWNAFLDTEVLFPHFNLPLTLPPA